MEKRFANVLCDLKTIKIQGATNIAKAALFVYEKNKTKAMKKKLLSLRPTEPLMHNILDYYDKTCDKSSILYHLSNAQKKINKLVYSIIKNNSIIFTHCHSTSVIRALAFAKNKGKNFAVYVTETRPLFQGRKTALELKKAHIKVLTFVDSAVAIALQGKQGIKKPNIVFLGADAIVKRGVINKVGSGLFSHIAFEQGIPVYILADSWKFSQNTVRLEERNFHEVWHSAPKNIKIKNPAFELIDKSYIKSIISELGILSFDKFLNKAKKVVKEQNSSPNSVKKVVKSKQKVVKEGIP